MKFEGAMANGMCEVFIDNVIANGASYGKGDRHTAAPNE